MSNPDKIDLFVNQVLEDCLKTVKKRESQNEKNLKKNKKEDR